MMSAPQQLVWFAGGTILGNAMFHLICGVNGSIFPLPFAKPRGEGSSGFTVNMLRGVVNLRSVRLPDRVADVDSRPLVVAGVFGQVRLPAGARLARGFSRLDGGNASTEWPVTQ